MWRVLRPASRHEMITVTPASATFPARTIPEIGASRGVSAPSVLRTPRSAAAQAMRQTIECRSLRTAVSLRESSSRSPPDVNRGNRGQFPEGPSPSAAFTMWRAIDGFSLSLRVEYAYQSRPKGT